MFDFLVGQFCLQQSRNLIKLRKLSFRESYSLTTYFWRESSVERDSWRWAIEIYWSPLFSEGSCLLLDACPVMSSSRFLLGRSFWIHGSNFKPRHYQEVGNVNQWFTLSLAVQRVIILEEVNKNTFVMLLRTFNASRPLCCFTESAAWFPSARISAF